MDVKLWEIMYDLSVFFLGGSLCSLHISLAGRGLGMFQNSDC